MSQQRKDGSWPEPSFVNCWLQECGRIDPIYPDGVANGRDPTSRIGQLGSSGRASEVDLTMFVSDDGALCLRRNRGGAVTEMARFVGERRLINQQGGVLLLNGDGFESQQMQAIQTRIRERARHGRGALFGGQKNILIVPYAALRGAEIDLATILPVFAQGDFHITEIVSVRAPLDPPETRWPGRAFTREWLEMGGRTEFRYATTRGWANGPLVRRIMFQPRNGAARWHDVRIVKGEWFVTSQVHVLGASGFSAVGPDGERHRYISSFDPDEPTPMYFLAQLPDEGEYTNYQDAINLLAPPIVHEARRQGLHVARQGDVFAIEAKDVDLDDSNIQRRDQVFSTSTGARNAALIPNTNIWTRRHKAWKNLMIYGTGHTADIVAIKPNGATYIKGTMYHDPVLESAGRTREHANVPLKPDTWYLCVRNTVPRAVVKPKKEEVDVNSNIDA